MSEALVGTIRREPRIAVLDGRHLNWMIGEYIGRARLRIAAATVVCYECKLRWFCDWWEEVGPSKEWLLRQTDLLEFEKYLRQVVSPRTKKGLSYNSRNDVLRRLGEAFRWAQEYDYVERDYTKWVPKANGAPPLRRPVRLASLATLLDVAANSALAARDRAMLAMLIGMGLRRVEISNLNVEDVVVEADHSGYAHIYGKRTRANPNGERHAAFDKATGSIVVAYLDASGVDHGPLFLGRRHERITAQGVYKVIKRIIAEAGLEKEIQGCHDLRRAFATHVTREAKNKGEDARESGDRLRRQMGHVKYETTTDYILLDVEDIRRHLVSPISSILRARDEQVT